jgi:hypothetical protein
MSRHANETHDTVLLAKRLTQWLAEIGCESTGAGVDFADCIAAGKRAEMLLGELLALSPTDPLDAREALRVLGELHAWLLGEMRPHLDHLAEVWETLEDNVESRSGRET